MEQNYNPFEPTPEQDGSNNEQKYTFTPQPQPRIIRLNMFEAASIFLAIGAVLSSGVFYGAYVMGALAILFALLSRGEQMKMSSKAKFGLIVGIFAIVLSTVLTIGSVYIAIEEFGSLENALREYCQMFGLDFEQEFGILFE